MNWFVVIDTLIDWGDIGKARAWGKVTIFPIASLRTTCWPFLRFFQSSSRAIIIKLLYELAEFPNPGTRIINLEYGLSSACSKGISLASTFWACSWVYSKELPSSVEPIIRYAPRSSIGKSSFFEKLNKSTEAIIIKTIKKITLLVLLITLTKVSS